MQLRKEAFIKKLALGMAIFVISFAGGWAGGSSRSQQSFVNDRVLSPKIDSASSSAIRAVAEAVGPSVVSVNVTSQNQATGSESLYGQLFGMELAPQTQQSAGTGIIISSNGLVLTNRHVVPAGVSRVSVTLSDGTQLEDVKVVGRTSTNDSLDIAFLKIGNSKGKKLIAARLGDSSKMRVGDQVVAIGNTLGQFQNTVTTGIVSGYGRSIQAGGGSEGVETLDDLFQTDAAINQGNSGGPLVNMSGEVIGVNTAIAQGAQTVGFAIPMNNVKGLISGVEQKGRIERPYLGVRYIVLTDDIAKELDLSVTRGAYIPKSEGGVIADGPADKAGLKPGDVITKIDDKAIDEKASLVSILGKRNVGETVDLTVVREGRTLQLKAELAAAPAQ